LVVAPIEQTAQVAVDVPAPSLTTPTPKEPETKKVVRQASREQLMSNLTAVGLTWVETDQAKWNDVQRLLEQTPQAIRIPRLRKELAPISSEPLMQVETRIEFRSGQATQ
jgi:ribonuclease E